MLTIVVGAVLLTVGVPSMQALIRNNRLTTQTNEFVTALQLARSEAAKRNARVAIAGNAAGEYHQGLEVRLPGTNEVLRRVDSLTGGNSIKASPALAQIEFQPNGMTTAGQTVVFDICHSPTTPGRQVELLVSGRVATRTCEPCPCTP